MTHTADRQVHARTAGGIEIVRYERAGKWKIEDPDEPPFPVTVSEAAQFVIDTKAKVFDIAGGQRLRNIVIKTRSL